MVRPIVTKNGVYLKFLIVKMDESVLFYDFILSLNKIALNELCNSIV